MDIENQLLLKHMKNKNIKYYYEKHEIYEHRRNMTKIEPRLSGICGTITSVLKDNHILIYEE